MDIEIINDETHIRIYDSIDAHNEPMLLGWIIRYMLESFLEEYPDRREQINILLNLVLNEVKDNVKN